MPFNSQQPYNNLPPLPPEEELETKAVLKKCTKAHAALAELKGVATTIPNPAILIRSIGLQEARLSSEIENIVTTTDELYQAFADTVESINPAAKEVLRYFQALSAGVNKIDMQPILSTSLFCEIASTIKKTDMSVRKMPGTKIVDAIGKTIYTPPEGEDIIRIKLRDLEEFIHADSALDPLVRMAIVHYQFEAIHPFTDGNGRTGRILNILFLIQQGLLDLPILYLSRYLIEHKSTYYSGLRAITESGDWESWILFLLDGIEETSISARQRIVEIKAALERTHALMKERIPKIASKDFVELLFYHPYCKIRFIEEHLDVSRQTAAGYLKSLEEIGLLVGLKRGREMYFINKPLLEILAK
ncbi:MAG: Fic family protein [Cyanobacteria bacterium REEB67]|nr:Fic family protein [Cyanobacteria bacterium REEB67]